ncbi:RNA polymerase sigma factor [Castellaniella hirudinis]|uniref:RNA polymerase sigma factor n=1 Tax=Castellaniella hirudinis TaxID=1144617 RepID=UPI0039C26017
MEPNRPGSGGLLASLIRHYDDLVRYVGHRFGDADLARDVVHEVCVDLLNRPEPAGVRQPLAFLHRMLRNRAIDHRRGDAARGRLAETLAGGAPQVCHEDAAAYLRGLETVDDLADIICRLPDRARQVFILHRLYDMPLAAIARELDLSCSVVAKHQAQALRLIQARWTPAQAAGPVRGGWTASPDSVVGVPLRCGSRDA